MERIVLQETLPKEGDFVTLKLVRKLREALSFSEAEITQIELQYCWKCPKCNKTELTFKAPQCSDCNIYMVNTNQVTWDDVKAGDVIKDVHMGDSMVALCTTELKRLDNEKKLTQRHFSLYEKFIKAEEIIND